VKLDVIADEARRSRYGFGGKVNEKTGEMSYGFASNLRDALPNASFIGFTGTLSERTAPNTRAVFGENISIYDFQRAVAANRQIAVRVVGKAGTPQLSITGPPRR
jgi:type I restriction enzyme R subunit